MSQRLSSVSSQNTPLVFSNAEEQVSPELSCFFLAVLLIFQAVYFSFYVLIKFSNIYIKGAINMKKVASAKKRVPSKGTALKKAASRKSVAKNITLKKPAVKKSLVKKTAAKKATAKKMPSGKAAQNKITAKKAIQRKTVSKASAAKKTAPKKGASKLEQRKAAPIKKAAPQRVIKKTVAKAGPKKTVATTQTPKFRSKSEKLKKTAEAKKVSQKKTAFKPPVTKPANIAAQKALLRRKSSKKPAADVIVAPTGTMRAVTPSTEKRIPEKHAFPIKTARAHPLRAILVRLSRVQKPVIKRPADNIAALARTPLPNVRSAKLPFMKKIRHT